MKTIQELCAELNRWLAFRWQAANHGYELPTETAIVTYAKQMLQQVENASTGTNALHRIYEERRNNGLPETNAGLDVLCGIDVKTTPHPNGADDKRMLRVVTALGGPSEATLVAMPLLVATVEDAGEKIVAVTAVITPDKDADITDVFVDACRIQDSVGTDIFERWLSRDDYFREDHLICPSCGGPARFEHEDGRLTCGECGWASRWKYDYQDEFAEESNFRNERDFLAKAKAFDEKQAAALAQINEGVAALEVLYAAPLRGHNTRAELERECKSLCLKLAKLIGNPSKLNYF